MAGVLSFTLGLETSNFLRGIGLASGQIISLSGVMSGLHKAMDRAWQAIEEGGALNDLANRTGESVKTLFLLQEAFRNTGLSGGEIPGMIHRLQLSLSGLNESGERTERIFSALGLNMAGLKGMDAPRQFEKIAEAFGKLPREQASFAAATIFGREGAGAFLQIMRDLGSFSDTLKQMEPAAAVVARTAPAFDRIGDSISTIKGKMRGMWAGIAEGAGPSIQQAIDQVNGLNFVGLGERIGKEIQMGITAIKFDLIGEYLSLSLRVGMEEASNFMIGEIMKWSDKLKELSAKPADKNSPGFLKKLGYGTAGAVAGLSALDNEAAAYLGIRGAQKRSDDRFDLALALFEKGGLDNGFLMDAAAAQVKASERGRSPLVAQWEELRSKLDALKSSTGGASEAMVNAKGKILNLGPILGKQFSMPELFKMQWDILSNIPFFPNIAGMLGEQKESKGVSLLPQVSDWERIGLVLGGNTSSMETQHAASTARNTHTANGILLRIEKRLAGGPNMSQELVNA